MASSGGMWEEQWVFTLQEVLRVIPQPGEVGEIRVRGQGGFWKGDGMVLPAYTFACPVPWADQSLMKSFLGGIWWLLEVIREHGACLFPGNLRGWETGWNSQGCRVRAEDRGAVKDAWDREEWGPVEGPGSGHWVWWAIQSAMEPGGLESSWRCSVPVVCGMKGLLQILH